MFRLLGRLVRSFWWVFLIAWPALAVWLRLTSPMISEVATDDSATYLPPYAESVIGRDLLSKAFPKDTFPATAVIVVADRYEPLTDEDLKYVERLTKALSDRSTPNRPRIVLGVISITNQPELKPVYVSKDGRATLIRVGLDTVWISRKAREAVAWIRGVVAGAPSHLDVQVTGDAGLGADYTGAIGQSLHRTTVAAITLVVLILLIIYRSPIAPLVPLASIAMGYLISNALIARAIVSFGYKAPRMTQMFLVVLVFGAGTDYCLFLIARVKEHLAEGLGPVESVQRALGSVGAAITSSAATVIVGLGLLYFMEFKEFGHIGPAIAFGLLVMLVIALTFAPSLMLVMGRLILWPAPLRRAAESGDSVVWGWIARRIRLHPLVTFIAVLVIFLPLFVVGWRMRPSYDIIGQLRSTMPSVAGFDLLKKHFEQGEMLPVTLVVQSFQNQEVPSSPTGSPPERKSRAGDPKGAGGGAADLRESQYLDAQAALAAALRRHRAVQTVRSAVEPYGTPKEFARARFAGQVKEMISGAGRGTAGIDEMLKGIGAMKSGLAEALKYVHENQQKVAARAQDGTFFFIPVPGPAEYKTAAEGLARLAAGLDQLSAGLDRMETGLKSLREGMVTMEQRLAPLADENGPYGYIARRLYVLPKDFETNPDLKKALGRYISPDGRTARLSIILKYPPHSLPATRAVEDLSARLPDLLADAGLPDARAYLAGATPTINDVRLITQRDYYRMMALVIGGVLVILFFQFRSLVALVYLVGTVLLSYVATMGIVLIAFEYVSPWLLGTGVTQIDWKVRFFMFVFMVALGEDYNIFIMSRIQEECRAHGPFLGVERAVVRTGNIISSCGVIMAGTFCAMMASPLPIVVQIGFGIACGMLVDTFLVRPILLPAIILLLAPYKLTRTPPPADSDASRSPHAQ